MDKTSWMYRWAVVMSLVLCINLAGCATVQAPACAQCVMGAGETIQGLQAALREAPGTFIMQHGNQVLIAFPKGTNYAFACLNTGGKAFDLAVKTNPENLSQFVKALEDAGWKYIGPAAVPATVSRVVMAYSVELVMAGVQSLPTILVIPVYLVDPSNWYDYGTIKS